MPASPETEKKVTTATLRRMKKEGEYIAMLTAYDATFASLLDTARIDVLLIGDSLGNVIQGGENTLNVSVDDIIYHTRAVKRGAKRAHIVGDMPFMSYQTSIEEALKNCGRVLKEGGAEAVKLEGGFEVAETVQILTDIGIPVMGHIGLEPQKIHATGGYKVRGHDLHDAERLLEEALALEEAGAYAIVLESVAIETAGQITEKVNIPTIGIGSGPCCDGQVLVLYDMLGMTENFRAKHVKKYADLAGIIRESAEKFKDEVKEGIFPTEEHAFHRRLNIVPVKNRESL